MPSCAYIYERICNADCLAYNPYSKPTVCSRLNNEERIADAIEALKVKRD